MWRSSAKGGVATALASATLIIESQFAARARDLKKALREKVADMGSKGQLGLGPAWTQMLEMHEAEVGPRAEIVREAFVNALRTLPKAPKKGATTDILMAATELITKNFDALVTDATTYFVGRPSWYVPRLKSRADEAEREIIERIRLDVQAIQTNAESKVGVTNYKNAIVTGLVTVAVSAVMLFLQKSYYDGQKEKAERRKELYGELVPRLEAFRQPLSDVVEASQDTTVFDYRRHLEDAISSTKHAVFQLGDGYDLLKTRVRLEYDSALVAQTDSLGLIANSLRMDLERTLVAQDVAFADVTEPKNPGEYLTAFQALNDRVTAIETKLLTFK